ncbi:MAG: MATE family efflux transporter [Candidatus Hodarchaeales archaeon]
MTENIVENTERVHCGFINTIRDRLSTAIKSYPWDYMFLIFLAWAIPAFYGLANRYFIGFMNYESIVVDQSYEAMEVSFEVLLEMFPIAMLALVARYFTSKKKISEILVTAIIMQVVVTFIFVILVILFADHFIDWINTPEGARNLALRYFRMKTIALPFQTISLLFIITIKAMRRGKLAVFLAFIGVILNFFLDAVFISNYSFSFKLGLMGSAYDNILANVFLFLISGGVVFWILRKDLKFKFNQKYFLEIFKIGKWTGLESFVRNLGYIVGVISVVNYIGRYEEEAIGGYNTAIWVMWAIVLIPVLAWTEATQIAIGNAYGKKNIRLMKDVQIVSTIVMGFYMVAWVFIGIFAWGPISEWLNQGIEEDVVKYSIISFSFLIFPYILFAINSGLRSFFIGTGRPMVIFISSAIVNLLIYVPLGFIVKYEVFHVSYRDFLIVTNIVFIIDLVIVAFFLWRFGYRKIGEGGSLKSRC